MPIKTRKIEFAANLEEIFGNTQRDEILLYIAQPVTTFIINLWSQKFFYQKKLYQATDSVDEAKRISKDLKNLVLHRGFTLTKRSSNSMVVISLTNGKDLNPLDIKKIDNNSF